MSMRPIKTTHFGIQRKIVAAMTTQSWQTVPHIGYSYEPDVTEFMKTVKELNASGKFATKMTVNTIMLKAITEGLKCAPALNAHIQFDPKFVRGSITQFENIDVSMTWELPTQQMMTINLKDLGSKSLTELNDYIKDTARRIENTNFDEAMYSVSLEDTLTALKKGKVGLALKRLIGAKTGKYKIKTLKGKEKKEYEAIPETDRLTKEDLRQGTVCVSNIGSTTRGVPGRVTLLAVIPPEVFVMCMGAIQKIPMVKQDEEGNDIIVPGMMLPICFVFDHRAVDFDEIVPFINRMEEIFHHPEEMYNW